MTITMKEQESVPGEMIFPEAKLRALEEKITNPRWVVPVLPEQELEALLNAATELAIKGEDVNNPLCQCFYNDALILSFTKILTDDAVSSWKHNIQQCVRSNCEKLVRLCAIKLDDPRFLNLLSMVLNPNNKFHTFNASRTSEGLVLNSVPSSGQGSTQDQEVFARSQDHRTPRGWLVHLINIFGQSGGFIKLRERFEAIMGFKKSELTASLSSEEKVSNEIIEKETEEQNNIADHSDMTSSTENMEGSITSRSDQPSSLEISTSGESRVAAVWQLLRPLGLCHDLLTPHTVTVYLLPILECIPTLLESLTDDELKREARGSENKTDTVSCLIRACKCVSIKTPQYHTLLKSLEMFRLKMILRLLLMSSFNGKMSALNEINQLISTMSQQPKPEWLTPSVITTWIQENNVIDIVLRDSLHQPQYVERLEKMLRFMLKENSLTRENLDAIWKAQHGKHEAIVKNVHDLLAKLAWDFTPDQLDHLFDCFKASWSTSSKKQSDKLLEVIRRLAEDDKDGVMANKVLNLFWNLAHSDDVCTEIMDSTLANFIKILDFSCSQDQELKNNEKWVVPALKVLREICCTYESGSDAAVKPQVTRQELIDQLQSQHSLVILVTDSLTNYMDKVREKLAAEGHIDWENWLTDGRYPHSAQVNERLSFLRFLLKDGQLWLCAEQPAHIGDREACFRWFSKLMGEEPDLDPNINLHFFRRNIMTLPPHLLTHSGIKCFERFFKAVNCKEGKLKVKRHGFLLVDPDLIGLDYLWRVITECDDDISARGIELLRETCTCVGTALHQHESFLKQCCARTQGLHADMDSLDDATECCTKMCRVIRAIQEYINECDRKFSVDRQILPIYRAGRGRQCTIVVRFNFQTGQRQIDDIEILSHYNETLHSLRTSIQRRIKCASDNSIKLEMYINKLELYINGGDILDSSLDRKILSQIPLRDKTVLIAKHIGITKGHVPLTEAAHLLSQICPAHKLTVEKLTEALLCRDESKLKDMLYGPAPPTVLYSMIMPSSDTKLDRNRSFQLACVKKAPLLVQCLSDSEFLKGAAPHTRRVGYLALVRLAKVVLYTVGHLLEIISPEGSENLFDKEFRMDITILREALQTVTNHSGEIVIKAVSEKLAAALAEQMVTSGEERKSVSSLVWWHVPTNATVRALYSLSYSVSQPLEMTGLVHCDDVILVRECMEVVSWLRAALAHPDSVDDTLLEGHLNLTKELFTHVPAQIKFQYGAHPDHKDSGLIKEVTTEFLWPYSWAWWRMMSEGDGDNESSKSACETKTPLCRTAGAAAAATDLLLALNSGDYNITILKQVQAIFAHLCYSKLQYYVPRGLWAHFRLQGEPVNLREQQDAVEFFMSLVETLDEALKSLGQEQLMAKTMGGTFSDQKICKGCPHRYCKEEPFSVVSLDIRNMSRLQESLEAYVRGELLEGADAYYCDKCSKKVVTVKRLCLNKLPPVLVIQLKRFEYDFEKVCAIKESSIPKPIWNSIRRSNIAFCHNQDQFSLEHFNFMKKLCCMRLQSQEHEEMSMIAIQIATKFLFQVGFHTKKSLRGPATDWYDILCQHMRCSQAVRAWFASELFKHPHRLCDYLLSCPSADVRLVFMKLKILDVVLSVCMDDSYSSVGKYQYPDTYMKKLTEECCGCDEGVRLLQFLCWEHAGWSRGVSEERVGLLETALRARGHYQKRTYACVKLLVGVMCRSGVAARALHTQLDYGPGYGSYGTWSPPGTSNETSSGYFLERSNSARKTLENFVLFIFVIFNKYSGEN
ncbi:unnamed protein product [Leptidea sinapis]|uniref:ubiquitinyl hydrolase 1 n=1 Tax=Leptidea sinapis TaxID=189913 RepID=A0A5E4QH54_9NEOP|nr:unnamed protein product [Leptidea sinapis]